MAAFLFCTRLARKSEGKVTQNNLLVMKFGGTSIGTPAAMAQAVRICLDARRAWGRLVVVTSALSGVTDRLIASAEQAARGDLSVFNATLSEQNERHHHPHPEPDVRRAVDADHCARW